LLVTLVLHLEQPAPGSAVWWAESPELPGSFATREHLAEALQASEDAAMDILRDQGIDTGEVRFRLVLAQETGASSGVPERT
jgi:predicted RNase H-like HicB family nuclease